MRRHIARSVIPTLHVTDVHAALHAGFGPSFGPEEGPGGDRESCFADAEGNGLRFGESGG